MSSLTFKFYGTRGSTPISNPKSVRYGGNTTCVQIKSECLPEGTVLVMDAGTGLIPLTNDNIQTTKEVRILYTHYHHDHIQGAPLSKYLFMKHIPLHFIGPIDSEIGPKKMMESLLVPPFFPVHYKKVASHFHYKGLDFPGMYVILYHPLGGQKILSNDEFEKTESSKAQINFSTSKYSLNECLVVKMFKSSHPEQTISYRFEERSTGRIGVILTDHEKQAGLPMELGTHLRGAHFIAMDSQYTEERYNHPKFPTAGFGHATPDYCATTALQVECEHLGLIHHDPESTDEDVDSILASAQRILQDSEIKVSAIEDYQEIVV